MYTSLFKTKWDNNQLLKSSLFAFGLSYFGTLLLFFIGLGLISGFNIWWLIVNLQWLPDSLSVLILLGVSLFQMTSWIGVLQLLHYRKYKSLFSIKFNTVSITLRRGILLILLFTTVLFVLSHLFDLLLGKLGVVESDNGIMGQLVVNYPILCLIFFPIVGMFEEVFFRGILQETLSTKYLPIVGLIVSSLIFTGLHGTQYGIETLTVVFLMSLILGLIYQKYKNIYINMGIHYCNNLIAVVLVLISGTIPVQTSQNDEYNFFTKSASEWNESNYAMTKYYYQAYLYKNCKGTLDQVDQFYDTTKSDEINKRLLSDNCDLNTLRKDLELVVEIINRNNKEENKSYADHINKILGVVKL